MHMLVLVHAWLLNHTLSSRQALNQTQNQKGAEFWRDLACCDNTREAGAVMTEGAGAGGGQGRRQPRGPAGRSRP